MHQNAVMVVRIVQIKRFFSLLLLEISLGSRNAIRQPRNQIKLITDQS